MDSPNTNARLSDSGYYVDLEKTQDGHLRIVLNPSGQEQFADIELEHKRHGILAALYRLLDDHLGNGWEFIAPEDIGALTAAPILSEDVTRDDQGNLVSVGRVYWFPEYAITDEIEELRHRATVTFQGVP